MKNLCCGQKALILGGLVGAFLLWKKRSAAVGGIFDHRYRDHIYAFKQQLDSEAKRLKKEGYSNSTYPSYFDEIDELVRYEIFDTLNYWVRREEMSPDIASKIKKEVLKHVNTYILK